MPDYFVDMDGQTTGPMTVREIAKLHRQGSITNQTLYTFDGASQWYPIGYLRSQFPKRQQSAIVPCVIAVLLLAVLLFFRHWQAASIRNEDEQRAIARLKTAFDGIQAGCLAQTTYQEFRQREMDFEVAIQNNRPDIERFHLAQDFQEIEQTAQSLDAAWTTPLPEAHADPRHLAEINQIYNLEEEDARQLNAQIAALEAEGDRAVAIQEARRQYDSHILFSDPQELLGAIAAERMTQSPMTPGQFFAMSPAARRQYDQARQIRQPSRTPQQIQDEISVVLRTHTDTLRQLKSQVNGLEDQIQSEISSQRIAAQNDHDQAVQSFKYNLTQTCRIARAKLSAH
jgi:hypothetical protein